MRESHLSVLLHRNVCFGTGVHILSHHHAIYSIYIMDGLIKSVQSYPVAIVPPSYKNVMNSQFVIYSNSK